MRDIETAPAVLARTPDTHIEPDDPRAVALRKALAGIAVERAGVEIPDGANLDELAQQHRAELEAAREEWLDVVGALGLRPAAATTQPGVCRRAGCNNHLPTAVGLNDHGRPSRRGYCSPACEARTAEDTRPEEILTPGAPAEPGWRWRYLPAGNTRHLVHRHDTTALCGVENTGGWRGHADPKQRGRLTRLRPCTGCVRRKPEAAAWEIVA